MIVQDGVQVPRTHNIEALIEQLPVLVAVPEGVREAADLTQYAVVARYPAGVANVSDEEHRRAVAQAEAVVAWAERQIEKPER